MDVVFACPYISVVAVTVCVYPVVAEELVDGSYMADHLEVHLAYPVGSLSAVPAAYWLAAVADAVVCKQLEKSCMLMYNLNMNKHVNAEWGLICFEGIVKPLNTLLCNIEKFQGIFRVIVTIPER